MMKKLITFYFLIIISFSVNAQQLSDYYDAVSNGRDGFSYTITVRIQKTADNKYTATLLQLTPDPKGYYDAYRGKLYTCSQLGNVCQPNNFGRLTIATRYESNGQEEATGNYSFTRLNETVVLGMRITQGAIDGKPRDASNFKLELMGGTLAVSHTTEIQNKISQLENLTLSGTTSAASSNNSSSTNQSSATQTTSPIPSLESQYEKLGIPANTPTYTKSEITTQVVTQAADLVGGLLNDWNASRDKRIAAERAAYEQQQSIEAGERLKKYEEKFIAKYLPLMDKAKRGDENARMTLYFASASLYSKEYVPLRDQWFEEALKNNNTDAIVEVARITAGKPGSDYDLKKALPYLEKAANLGNVDAMVILGSWYSIIPNTTTYKGHSSFLDGGQNPKLALEMFKAAAERGSPNAMYYLGMIYKYGQIYSFTIKKYNKAYAQFDVILDEKVSLDWFMKSLNPSYEESLYSKSLLHNGVIYYETSSYFNPSANFEISISIIYNKKGKVNPGYEEEAKEFEKIRTESTYEMINKQKIKN